MSPNAVAVWGHSLVETDIDRLVLLRLRMWLPDYLTQAEIERDLPGGLIARPHAESYQNVLEDDDFPDSRLPAVVVTTARTDGQPEKLRDESGDDRWTASWRVQVSVIARGRTGPETRELAAVFGGCVRRILAHQQLDLEGEVWWAGSSVVPVADSTDQGRSLAAGINQFTVLADEVITGSGPVLPNPDNPYPEPDPGGPETPGSPYDPLAVVREGGVITTIIPRS